MKVENSKRNKHRKSLTNGNIDREENDELWKVENELGIRKKLFLIQKHKK